MSETQIMMAAALGLMAVTAAAAVAAAWSVHEILKAVRRLDERAREFCDAWQPVASETSEAVKDFSEQSGELLSRLNGLSALLHKQALQADAMVQKVATAANRNIESVDETVQGTLDRIKSASESLERAVKLPAVQMKALAAGIRAALRELSFRGRKDTGRVSTDEEMFI